MFLYLGLFTLVVLPLFLVISARMLQSGDGESAGRKIGATILYIFAGLTVLTGIALIYTAISRH